MLCSCFGIVSCVVQEDSERTMERTLKYAINITDFISLTAVIIALVLVLKNWGSNRMGSEKYPLVAYLLVVLIRSISNFLEWINIVGAMDPYEDYVEVLGPVLWIFLVYAFLQDRNKKRLRESEERFKQLTDHLDVVFWLSDNSRKRMVYVSSAYQRIWGMDSTARCDYPEPFMSIIHPDDREKVMPVLEVRTKGKPTCTEFRVLRPDNGAECWISSRTFPVYNSHGDAYRIAGIAEEITEQKKAEKQMLEDQAQLKLLASELAVAEERERRRLAKYLHDEIGQLLISTKLKMGNLKKLAIQYGESGMLADISSSLDKAIKDTRTLTFDLSSPILQELGLEAAVAEWLSDEIEQKHDIEVEFEDDGKRIPIDDDHASLIFRDLRELLVNVVKHSQATKVKVSISKNDENIIVSVEDNGVGFNPHETTSMISKKATFGLFSIRQRLGQMGGSFELISKPGKGCRAEMVMPRDKVNH